MKGKKAKRIDRIFASEDCKGKSIRVFLKNREIEDCQVCKEKEKKCGVSDHYAVEAEIEI